MGSSTSRVVMFGTIPTVTQADVSTIVPVVSEVAAAIVTSPTGVLDLDVHTTSKTDLIEDLLSLVHAPVAPIISLFLHSFEASDDSFGSDSFKSLSSLDLHEVVVARWRGKVASRSVSSSFTHALPSTNIASPTPHQIVPAPPGVPRRPAILVLSGQEIPFGRPYRTHPDRVLMIVDCEEENSPSSTTVVAPADVLGPSTRDRPATTADDSPIPHRFVNPHPVRTPRDSEVYRRWKAAPLSNVYPSTTFKSSSGDFYSDSSTSSSEKPPHSFATHSPIPSPSAGLSRKRFRSPASVPLATPIPGALSLAHADILLPRKTISGFSAASSSEDSSEGSIEVGSKEEIDSDVMADIVTDIAAEAAVAEEIRAETKVGFIEDDEAEDKAESSSRGTIEIGVDRVVVPEIPTDSLVLASDGGSRENSRLEIRALADEKERTRLREREELRQIRSSRYHDKMDVRRLEIFAIRRLGYRP
ncbi:hypothetical protein Tco_0994468 [Tanacetum coccineum]